jgi:hypothetical protein
MLRPQHIIAFLVITVPASAADATEQLPLTPEGHHYSHSLSGEIRGSVKYDSDCKQTHPDLIDGVFVVAEEVAGLGEPRRMIEPIHDGDFIIDNREPYRDYRVMLMHRKENHVISSIYLPAYNSPERVDFSLDCKELKNQIVEQRRQRAVERSKKNGK